MIDEQDHRGIRKKIKDVYSELKESQTYWMFVLVRRLVTSYLDLFTDLWVAYRLWIVADQGWAITGFVICELWAVIYGVWLFCVGKPSDRRRATPLERQKALHKMTGLIDDPEEETAETFMERGPPQKLEVAPISTADDRLLLGAAVMLQVAPIYTFIKCWREGVAHGWDMTKQHTGYDAESRWLKLMEAFGESLPQATLQYHIFVVRNQKVDTGLLISVISSFLSIATTVTNQHIYEARQFFPDTVKPNWKFKLSIGCLCISDAMLRVFAWVLILCSIKNLFIFPLLAQFLGYLIIFCYFVGLKSEACILAFYNMFTFRPWLKHFRPHLKHSREPQMQRLSTGLGTTIIIYNFIVAAIFIAIAIVGTRLPTTAFWVELPMRDGLCPKWSCAAEKRWSGGVYEPSKVGQFTWGYLLLGILLPLFWLVSAGFYAGGRAAKRLEQYHEDRYFHALSHEHKRFQKRMKKRVQRADIFERIYRAHCSQCFPAKVASYLVVIGSFFVLVLVAIVLSTTSINEFQLQDNGNFHWIGNVTDHSAEFKIIMNLASGNDDLNGVRHFRLAATPVNRQDVVFLEEREMRNGVNVIQLDNLNASAIYYYGFFPGAKGVTATRSGNFTTFPKEGKAANFSIAFGSSAFTGDYLPDRDPTIYNDILQRKPALFIHLGDIHNDDLNAKQGTGVPYNVPERRLSYAAAIGPRLQDLLSHIPIAYMYDDHDFTGDDASSEDAGASKAVAAYKDAVPHYPLAARNGTNPGVYQAWTVGRVRFIMTDLRAEAKETTARQMFSQTQEKWLISELSQHEDYAMMVWLSTKPWIGDKNNLLSGDQHTGDSWLGHAETRRRVATAIAAIKPDINNMVMLAGDAQMLGVDDGSHTDYVYGDQGFGFPVFVAGPLTDIGTTMGGQYSGGCVGYSAFPTAQYGTMEIIDKGDTACFNWDGWRENAPEPLIHFDKCTPFNIRASKDSALWNSDGPDCALFPLWPGWLVSMGVMLVFTKVVVLILILFSAFNAQGKLLLTATLTSSFIIVFGIMAATYRISKYYVSVYIIADTVCSLLLVRFPISANQKSKEGEVVEMPCCCSKKNRHMEFEFYQHARLSLAERAQEEAAQAYEPRLSALKENGERETVDDLKDKMEEDEEVGAKDKKEESADAEEKSV